MWLCCCVGNLITMQQISGEYIGLQDGLLNLNPRRLRTVVGFSPLVDEDDAEPARVRHLRHVDPMEVWVWGCHTSCVCVRSVKGQSVAAIYGVAWCRKRAMKCGWRSSWTLDLSFLVCFRLRLSQAQPCNLLGNFFHLINLIQCSQSSPPRLQVHSVCCSVGVWWGWSGGSRLWIGDWGVGGGEWGGDCWPGLKGEAMGCSGA